MPSLAFSIHSDVSELKTATKNVVDFLGENAVPATAAYFTRLAVEELIVNVIRHAFDRAGRHDVYVALDLDESHMHIRVEDEGTPFDPTEVPDPDLTGALENRVIGGWGIYLVRSVSERMAYQREGRRNRVTVDIPLDVRAR